MIYNQALRCGVPMMVRRLLFVALIGTLLSASVGCRLCGKNGRLFNKDWSSRERDRPKPKDDSGAFLREPLDDRMIPNPDLPPTSGGVDLPPLPETRQRYVEPAPTPPPRPGRELLLPQDDPKPSSSPPSRAGGGLLGTPEPLEKDRETEARKTPVSTDLDGYTRVKSNIANGRVPTATGMEKLKTAGFTAIAYLHEPGANVDGVRRDAESKGLKFVSVPMGATEFAEGMKALSAVVADRSAKPLYVCDEDGTRTGIAWYSYFRSVEFANDDTAKLLAAPLGLTDTTTGDRGTLRLAAQKYLADRP
jgi:hypothetical protein